MPQIIHHYQHHNEQEYVGWFDFIAHHVADTDHQDKDHDNLPWSQKQTIEPCQVFDLIAPVAVEYKQFREAQVSCEIQIFEDTYHYSGYVSTIWQPPKGIKDI